MSLQGAKESNEEQIEIFADLKSKIGNSLFPFRKIGNFKITKRGIRMDLEIMFFLGSLLSQKPKFKSPWHAPICMREIN